MTDKTILVIDDDSAITMLAEELLSAQGYRVVTASSGIQGLEEIKKVKPDLVLLDIMMPDLNGYETCTLIKAIPEFEYTPVIMLTGRDDVDAIEKSYASGAWDFTPKPVNWPMLIHRVRHALRASTAFAAESQAARLSRAIEHSPSEVLLFEKASLKLIGTNASAGRNLGYSNEELLNLRLDHITVTLPDRELIQRIGDLQEGQQIQLKVEMKRKDGSSYPAEGILIRSPEMGRPTCIGIFQDISERKRAEEELYRLAFYDALTGLPNRRLLQEHVERALAVAERRQSECAICILDLDGFKRINDSLGHKVGDLILKEVSHRLTAVLRSYDVVAHAPQWQEEDESPAQVARLGGDEFLMLLTELEDSTVPARVASRILKEISLPYNVHKTELNLTGSIGISMYPQDASNLDELMMHADAAMYKAKQAGKNSYAFFTSVAGEHTEQRLKLESDLRSALARGELELHYQPQLDNSLSHIVGAEALLRWRHPEQGLLYPDAFIPLAEETGLIVAIGEWVMQEALTRLQEWSDMFKGPFKMAVNVSGYQLRDNDFLPRVSALLEQHATARNDLVIELTESTLMGSAHTSMEWLEDIKRAGVEIAIDDFGTGYSSLGYLQKFPIDYVKVDRSFVHGLDSNPEGEAIVRAIFSMAQALGIRLTVEGVETVAELETLREIGDSLIQGWLVSKALEPEQFRRFAMDYEPPAPIQPDPRQMQVKTASH